MCVTGAMPLWIFEQRELLDPTARVPVKLDTLSLLAASLDCLMEFFTVQTCVFCLCLAAPLWQEQMTSLSMCRHRPCTIKSSRWS